MIKKLLKILKFDRFKRWLIKLPIPFYVNKEKGDYIQQMISKGIISKSVASKYLKEGKDPDVSIIIQQKIEERIKERDYQTNLKYKSIAKIIISKEVDSS